jgi:hypothetical protein
VTAVVLFLTGLLSTRVQLYGKGGRMTRSWE